jgi:putative ABC transport system permease protein
VVVDAVLAKEHNIVPGDKLTLQGKQFTVVGLSNGTSMWAASLMFVRKDALAVLMGRPGMNSFLLVTPAAGVSPQALHDQLSSLPALQNNSVLLKSEMIANDTQLFARVYTAPITIMVIIAFLVGALVVGLIIYTATMERQREYGVLKAIGAHNSLLYRLVVAQALIASSAGSLIGVALAYLVGQLIIWVSPQLLVAIAPIAVGESLLAGLVMALLGALLPARAVARLAPAEVFRS